MFSNLGLFREIGCPDAACARSPCWFSHDAAVRASSNASAATVRGAAASRTEAGGTVICKRKASATGSAPVEPPPSPARRPTPAKTNGHGIITGSADRSKQIGTGVPTSSIVVGLFKALLPAGRPMLTTNVGSSKETACSSCGAARYGTPAHGEHEAVQAAHPGPTESAFVVLASCRPQEALISPLSVQRLFEEYSKLVSSFGVLLPMSARDLGYHQYIHVYPGHPDLAGQHATEQELAIAAATNKATYHSNVQSALISIRARTKPDTIDSPFVGTVAASVKKVADVEARKASQLSRKRLRRYLLPLDEYAQWGYMLKVPEAPGGTEPEAVGQTKTCDRCRVDFTVSNAVDYATMAEQREKGECIFHWGRPMPIRQDGRKLWVYSCCREPRGSEGCTDGLHVFKDGDARGLDATLEDKERGDLALHQRVEFKEIEDIVQEAALPMERKTQDVVAMDCEMICQSTVISTGTCALIDRPNRHDCWAVAGAGDGSGRRRPQDLGRICPARTYHPVCPLRSEVTLRC